jgi:hypothetical protein
MAKQSTQLQALADHELEAADRMKWWGIFLVREKRRLQGIANAVQGLKAEQALSPNAAVTEHGMEDYGLG